MSAVFSTSAWLSGLLLLAVGVLVPLTWIAARPKIAFSRYQAVQGKAS